MATLDTIAPPRLRWRSIMALFVLAVGAILGAVPGWTMCCWAWVVFAGFVLACVILSSLLCALFHLAVADWGRARVEAGQIAAVAIGLVALLPTPTLSTWIQLARVHGDLMDKAEASVRAGGPRLAMTTEDGGWPTGGIVYDAGGEISKPPQARSVAWTTSPAGQFLDTDGVGARHLVGPYYCWGDACGFR